MSQREQPTRGEEPAPPSGATPEAGGEVADEELIARLREQFGSLPAAAIVADTVMSLVPVAYVRLGIPPEEHAQYADLGEARVIIDAIAGLLGGVAGRLAPYEQELLGVLAQLRLAYAAVAESAAGVGPASGASDAGAGAGPGDRPAAPEQPAPASPVVPTPRGTRPSGLWVPGD